MRSFVPKVDGSASLAALRFERGLDSIWHGSEPAFALPVEIGLIPADAGAPPLTEQWLARNGIEDLLLAAMRPDVYDRALLRPDRFRAALEAALAALSTAPVQAQPDPRRLPCSAISLELATRAQTLLRDEISLRELLGLFRGALFQG